MAAEILLKFKGLRPKKHWSNQTFILKGILKLLKAMRWYGKIFFGHGGVCKNADTPIFFLFPRLFPTKISVTAQGILPALIGFAPLSQL
jgi:hypothetical protein